MVAPTLHDVINAPVKHIALQLVFYAVLHAAMCHPKDLFGSMAAAECIDAVEIRTCTDKILTYVKVNCKIYIQSKYIVIGNTIDVFF